MYIMAVRDRGVALHTCPCRIGLALASVNGVDFRSIGCGLLRGEQPRNQHIAILVVKGLLLGGQMHGSPLTRHASLRASQMAAVQLKSSPPLPVPSIGLKAS